MIILDRLLIGGITFILRRLVDAVDAELNDTDVLREELLALQMRRELGEVTESEFAEGERDLLQRLREIRERQQEAAGAEAGDFRVTGIEATVIGDEHDDDPDRRR